MRSFGNVFPGDYPTNSIVVEGDKNNGKTIWQDSCKISLHNSTTKDFIASYALNAQTDFDSHLVNFTYVDPSWCGTHLIDGDSSGVWDGTLNMFTNSTIEEHSEY